MSTKENDRLYELFIDSLDTEIACPYCGEPNQIDPPMLCCGELHAEKFYVINEDLVGMQDIRMINRAFEKWLCARENAEPLQDSDRFFKVD
jgi:hypothetical protein